LTQRSTTRTIRIDDDLDRKIERWAKEEGISANMAVNSALREFLDWHVVAAKLGMASFSLGFVNKLLQKFSDKECEDLGRWSARELFKPFAEYQFGNLTFESFLEVCERIAKYAGRYKFDFAKNGTEYVIFLKHGSGRKWSFYYSGLIHSIFEEMLGGDVKTELSDDLLISKITHAT